MLSGDVSFFIAAGNNGKYKFFFYENKLDFIYIVEKCRMVHYGYDGFSCSLLLIHSFLTLTLPYQLIVVYRYTCPFPIS
jgi:hypothetical protein